MRRAVASGSPGMPKQESANVCAEPRATMPQQTNSRQVLLLVWQAPDASHAWTARTGDRIVRESKTVAATGMGQCFNKSQPLQSELLPSQWLQGLQHIPPRVCQATRQGIGWCGGKNHLATNPSFMRPNSEILRASAQLTSCPSRAMSTALFG